MKREVCKFCKGTGTARYFDFVKCFESPCNKNLKEGEKCIIENCTIANGIDLCPDCNGLSYIIKEELIIQN